MLNPYDIPSHDAQRSLEEFSREFDLALVAGDSPKWAQELGLSRTSKSILTTYPIPISAAGYHEFKGEMKYRDLFERSISMKPKRWQDGVAALAAQVEAPDFVGWSTEPQRIAREADRLPNTVVAEMLEANPLLDLYREQRPSGSVASTIELFNAAHPVNIFDSQYSTFSNDITTGTHTAIDTAFVEAMKLRFRQIKAPNGKPMGLKMTHLLVPSEREEEARDFFEKDLLLQTVENAAGTDNVGGINTKNRHAGTVQIVVADELTDSDLVYPMAMNLSTYPWIVQDGGSPEEIRQDKSSYLYQSALKVGVSYILEVAAAAALPHGIVRVDLG